MGGPFDGVEVQPGGKRKGLFAWISEDGRRYERPREGRYLHRAELWRYPGSDDSRVAWVYAEQLWTLCKNCGSFYRKAEGGGETSACHLCGESPG